MDGNSSTENMLNTLNQRKSAILDRIKKVIKLSREIDELEDNLPERPKYSAEEYDEIIQREQFAFDHEDVGGSKVEYDKHVRRMKRLNQEKKGIDAFKQYNDNILKKRTEKSQIKKELDSLKENLISIEKDIARAEAQKRISQILKKEVNIKDIQSEEISIPVDSIARIIGKERINLHSLENELGVYISVSAKPKSSLVVYGLKSNISNARDILEDMSVQTSEQIDIPNDLVKVLLANKGKYITEIQNETRTNLSIDKEKGIIYGKGGMKALEKARKLIHEFSQNQLVFKIDKNLCQRLMSTPETTSTNNNNKSNNNNNNVRYIQLLHDETGAEFIVDFITSELKVYGRNMDKNKINNIVNKWIKENKEIELKIPFDEQRIIYYFTANSFEKVNEMRDISKANFNFSRDKKDPYVVIKGTEDEVNKAKELLEKHLENYKMCNIVVNTHSAAINVLRNNNNAKLKEIEEKTHCNVYIDKDAVKVRFCGATPEIAKAGKKEFDGLLSDFTLDRIEFDPYLLPLIIGANGSSINKIKAESQAFIDIEAKSEEASITLSGLTDQVTKAEELVKEFLHNNELGKIYVDSAALVPALIGKEGAIIKKLQDTYHVQIDSGLKKKQPKVRHIRKVSTDSEDTLSPKEKPMLEEEENHENETLIIVRGLEENVKNCVEEIKKLISTYLKENAFIPVSLDIADCCPYLRRSNLDKIQSSTNTTINYSVKFKHIAISGKEEDVQKAKKIIEESLEGRIVMTMQVNNEFKGIVIGKGGSKLKDFQTKYNVNITSKNENQFILWGYEKDCKAAKEGIDKYIKDTVQVEKHVPVNQNTIAQFIVDNFALVRKIQDDTGCHIRLPRKDELQVATRNLNIVIKGNFTEAEKGYEYVSDVVNNRVRFKFDLTADQIDKLEGGDFNVNRVIKETGCRIEFDRVKGSCLVVGTESSLAKAKSKILNMLIFYFPDLFYSHRISDTELSFLLHEKHQLNELGKKTGAKLDIDEINHNIWCSGSKESIDAVKQQINEFIERIRKENVVIYADANVIPVIIGKKGLKINKLREESGANITIGNNSDIFINGKEECVIKAKQLIETLIVETSKLNKVVSIPHQAISAILGNKGSTIKKVENDTGTYITVDKEDNTVNIRGSTEEEAEKAKEMIENIIKEYNATRTEREKENNQKRKERNNNNNNNSEENNNNNNNMNNSINNNNCLNNIPPPPGLEIKPNNNNNNKPTIPGLTFEDTSKFYPPKASKSQKRKIKQQIQKEAENHSEENNTLRELFSKLPSDSPYYQRSTGSEEFYSNPYTANNNSTSSTTTTAAPSQDNNYYKSAVGGYTVRL